MKTRITFAFGLFAVLLSLNAATESKTATKQPNVVVVFVDDLGWTDLGVYGSKFYETPHIDRLAKQGARFTRAYSSCNVCSPTRASLMTGKYPQRIGFTSWLNPGRPSGPNSTATYIPVRETTIGEAFQQAGYRTGYIGKWHVGSEEIGMPKQHGFDWQMATAKHGLPGSYFHPYKKKGLSTADVPDLEDGKSGDYLTDILTSKGHRVHQGDCQGGQETVLSHPRSLCGSYADPSPKKTGREVPGKEKADVRRHAAGNDSRTIQSQGPGKTAESRLCGHDGKPGHERRQGA